MVFILDLSYLKVHESFNVSLRLADDIDFFSDFSFSAIRSYKDIESYISGTTAVPSFPALMNQHSAVAWSLMRKLPVARLGVDNTTGVGSSKDDDASRSNSTSKSYLE